MWETEKLDSLLLFMLQLHRYLFVYRTSSKMGKYDKYDFLVDCGSSANFN